jgi:hypothetical protein
MPFRDFPFNFHDGQLTGLSIGPRSEVTLQVALDPVWNQNQERTVSVRFGAIRNYGEVAAFFGRIEPPKAAGRSIAEVIGLVHVGDRKDRVLVDLANHGSIEIQSRAVTVT